jgi:hypothetical protein
MLFIIRYIKMQIQLSQIWPIITVIVIPLFIYFIKLELRVRKVEELENKLSLEHRLKTLETDPVFNALKGLTLDDAISLYKKQGGLKDDPE